MTVPKHMEPNMIFEILKPKFKGYRVLDRHLRKTLKKLGFQITEGGKHYKLYYRDGKRPMTLAKTSSDVKTGMNFVHQIRTSLMETV